MNPVLIGLCLLAAMLSLVLLFSRNTLTCALSLLGVLLCTAGIYGMLGEHLVATLQLVVYAGAIMVLFIFSIMLLNFKKDDNEVSMSSPYFIVGISVGILIFALFVWALTLHMGQDIFGQTLGTYTLDRIESLGGNTMVLSHAMFSEYYLSFEVVSVALLTALVGAVVLAKRRVD